MNDSPPPANVVPNEQLNLAAGAKKAAAPADLLRLGFWARDAKITRELPYVLKGVFGRGQLVVFWGQPGSGKSFAATEMAFAIGSGQPWHGRRTRRGIVIYVAAESARVYIENRIAALRQEWPRAADAEVFIVPLALDLLHHEHGDVDRVIETVKVFAREIGEVALIVIDTLAVTLGGGNENASEDMGTYVENLQIIKAETGAALLIIHHCGKDEAKGMRGHSALLGALDAELVVEWTSGQPRILRTGKVREGTGHADLFAFDLRVVELGEDADGDQVTTCVLDTLPVEDMAKTRRRSKKLGKHQRAVFTLLEKHGGMTRADLVEKLRDEYGASKSTAHHTIADLIESGAVSNLHGMLNLA